MSPSDTYARAVRIGAFVLLGTALFAVGLFLIGDRRLLFAKQYELETSFTKVTGIQVGAKVRVSGLDAGEVINLDVPTAPTSPFVVRMRVRWDLAPLVRTDSVATIQTDGIVGNAFIQIGRGTDAAAMAPPGSRIRGLDPTELSDVLFRVQEVLVAFGGTVNRVSDGLDRTMADLDVTVRSVNGVMGEVGTSVNRLTGSASQSLRRVDAVLDQTRDLVQGVRDGEGTLGKLATDDALYRDLRGAVANAGTVVEQVRDSTATLREGTARLLARGGQFDEALVSLRGAGTALEEALADLAETTEAFKRNFFVRGFFERRGFFDIDALTPTEYRRFSGDSAKRSVLRVWLEANVLFATGPDGDEQLTAEGRARLDLAMGTFLEYRRDSPLVVEGYDTSDATAVQFLRSDARARLVRDYLVRRFKRETANTGTIGLGVDAQGAPGGDGRWNGVALALHIPK
jgi:phospholipid/cholesterol/gamma-HCH transport system substrate-binding protein